MRNADDVAYATKSSRWLQTGTDIDQLAQDLVLDFRFEAFRGRFYRQNSSEWTGKTYPDPTERPLHSVMPSEALVFVNLVATINPKFQPKPMLRLLIV